MAKRSPTASTTQRVIAYVRVSTDMQAESGLSLEAQRQKIHAWVQLTGAQLVRIEEDGGESAKSLERPALQRALASLRAGEADTLLVIKLDRLTRSVMDLLGLVREYFQDGGSDLVSISENIDTHSASGRLILKILASVAEWEREAIGERVLAAMRVSAEQGLTTGRLPLGYSSVGGKDDGKGSTINKTVAIDPEAARTVRQIFRSRAKGTSLPDLARAHGLSVSSVHTILKNVAYTGEWSWGGETTTRPDLTIISPELWSAVRAHDRANHPARLASQRPQRFGRGNPRYVLTGLVRCRECGGRLVVTGGKRRPGGAALNYLTCDVAKRRLGCSARELLRVDRATTAVLARLRSVLTSEAGLAAVRSAIEEEHAARVAAQPTPEVDRRAKIEAAIARLVTLECEGNGGPAVTAKRKALEAELLTLSPPTPASTPTLPSWTELRPHLSRLAERLAAVGEGNDVAATNALLQALTSGEGWTYEPSEDQTSGFLRGFVDLGGVGTNDFQNGLPMRTQNFRPSRSRATIV